MYKELWILNTCNLSIGQDIINELLILGHELKVENGKLYYKVCS